MTELSLDCFSCTHTFSESLIPTFHATIHSSRTIRRRRMHYHDVT
jgi:hypothetical protein